MTSFVKSLSCCNKWLHPFRRGAILCLVSKKDFCCGIAITLKRPKRISAQEAVVMLTRLSEDDPHRETIWSQRPLRAIRSHSICEMDDWLFIE